MDINPKQICGDQKLPMSTVSVLVLKEVGVAMLEGALHYGRHNYRNNEGIVASVYTDATKRHIDDWTEGEDIDPASGLNHITKAIASLTVLRDAMLVGTFIDDRPPKMKGFKQWRSNLEKIAMSIRKKYPNPVPPVTELNKKR